MSDEVDLAAPRPVRVGAFIAVAVLHVLAIFALVRAFAPDFVSNVAEQVVATFSVTITAPEPSPSPAPADEGGEAAGKSGEAGKQAVPRAVMAPKPRIVVPRPAVAPSAASTGSANASGTRDAGTGTGAGGTGTGTGSGGMGAGQGGGGSKAEKIAGDINSARDYPEKTRDQRIGDHVVVWLTVGIDGKPAACKVARASRDPEADAITCKLALARFRFRPATRADGQPVVSTYAWQQRWFFRNAPASQ